MMRALLRLCGWGMAGCLCVATVLAQTAPVTLVFAGDIVLDDDAGRMIERGQDPFAGFATLFKNADIRLGNLECVVATTGSAGDKNYTFRAHPRALPVLKRHFDAMALANNHSGDYGREAFAEMLGLMRQVKLDYFGGGHTLQEAHTPLIIERKGLRIALLGYNEFMPRSFEADFDAPGSAWSEDEQVVADIRAARSVHKADLVIPVMHWGWENETVANARQRQLARLMVDAGADVVIGGHPHVTQDIEHYRGKPIVYSVGNFVMKETDNANQRVGWVLRLRLDAAGVQAFDTRVARIDMQGIPTPDVNTASPCWQRGDAAVRQCRNPD
ncbi:poly-gamma-glutamate biosynthesis protein [Rhodoferax sp. TH121]|uniref:CapA family protein n=1 Tax=Rhodoferax sp. TH121 TaxID=2022803 RepID=UPI000B964D43|nr:CapA family protein [Rhodoferax sp. TH121]OYQ43101.1 poly-gamma-glutamate biosynthesis protein [Rhodoferax sp. TH121]